MIKKVLHGGDVTYGYQLYVAQLVNLRSRGLPKELHDNTYV